MSCYKVVYDNNEADYFEAKNLGQAVVSAACMKRPYKLVREASVEEVQSLMRSHSLPMEGE